MTRDGRPLGIVVVSYRSAALLAGNLTRVHAQRPDATVVVVDNWSTAAERRAVETLCQAQGWVLVPMAENRGFGGGANAGVDVALDRGAEDLLLLNPDAFVAGPDISRLQEAVAGRRLALAAPVIVDGFGSTWFHGVELDLRTGSMHRATPGQPAPAGRRLWLTGACLLATAEVWHHVGGFDERYFLYWEDVDLSHRVADVGGDLLVVTSARAVHDEGGSQQPTRTGAKSADYYYFNIRNRLLYAALHLDAETAARWRRTGGRAAYEVLLRGGRRQFLRPVAPVWAALRGMRDGRRLLRASGGLRPSSAA